eukprot:jgi/Chrpa1/12272/Chrysochromulina_OHIO_Genome00023067-RA
MEGDKLAGSPMHAQPPPPRMPRARAPTAKRQQADADADAALVAKKARTEAAAALAADRARQPPAERLSVAQQLMDRHATMSAQLVEARGQRARLAAFEHELGLHGIADGGVCADVDGIVDEANDAIAAHYALNDEGEPFLARSMPLTCAETGHVLLFDKKSPKSRAYVVNRARVSAMLHGLCHGVQARAAEGGFVHGGRDLEAEEPGAPVVMDGLIPTRTFDGRLYERYDGPDHEDGARLHGRWFLRGGTPNRYYRDVRIDADRLQSLPEEGEPEALVQVELDGGIAEHTDLAFKSNVEDVHRPVADLPAYFWTGSLPDNHLPGLMRLLRQHIEISRGAEAATLFDDDPQFRRRVMLDSQHVVTAYFDARQINYFNSVLVSVLQLDDAWWRYEGADGRGAIHTHLLGWSSRHARKVREALASSDDPSEQGLALYEWLQTSRADEPDTAGNMSSHDLTVIFGQLLDAMDGKGTVPQLVQKMLMRIVRCKDVPMSLATMYVSAAAPFTHSTRKIESFGLSGFKMIQPKASKTGYDSDADDDMPGQFAPGETGSAPDDAALVRMRKGLVDAMDADDAAAAAGDDGDDLLPPAYVGPPGFDWHVHALEGCTRGGTRLLDAIEYEEALEFCLKLLPEAAKQAEAADLADETGAVELPAVPPLSAVGNQRLAIALPLVRALAKRLDVPVARLRMFLIGGAGTGKSFVGKVNSRLARRLGGRNRAVLNVAPTGAACKQQVDGRTLASVMPLPRGEAARKSDEVAGGGRGGALSLPKRSLIHSLIGAPGGAPHASLLIVDEVFMNGLPQFAMASERLNEARDLPEGADTFGGIDTVIIQGDPGQLPAIGEDLELFERPPPTRLAEHPLEALGAVIYRQFDHAVMLDVSQRQKNLEMIQRLARLRIGRVTAADAAFYNARALPNLPPAERALFDGSTAKERVVTVVSNYEQAAAIQHGVQEQLRDQRGERAPVAVLQQPGRGKTGRAAAMCCQVPLNLRLAQGEPVMLSKSVQEGKLVRYGLFNGNVGTTVAFLFRKGCAPPDKPVAILVDFPAYTGPRAHPDWPATWVPILEEDGLADQTDGSTRRGFPLVSGAAIVGHKMQGITVGEGEAFTKVRFLVEDDVGVEAKNCGYTYVLFSRPKEDGDWCMMHSVVERRFTYINGQEALIGRCAEIERLAELAARTKACNVHILEPSTFTALLRRCDELAADGQLDGVCAACKAGKACEPKCAACEAGACVRPMAEWASCACVVCSALRELDAPTIASLVQAAPAPPPPLQQRRGGAPHG